MRKKPLSLALALVMALTLLPAAAFAAEEDAGGVDPSGPAESDGTETPGEPETPTDPDTPETPTDPGTPETPSQNNSSGGRSDIPGPGDLSITDVDFGNVEKGVNSSGDQMRNVLITNTSDRTIYVGEPERVSTNGDPYGARIYPSGGDLSIYFLGGARALKPGETLELPFYLRESEVDSYPFRLRSDYVFRASFLMAGQSFIIGNIYFDGHYIPEDSSALFSFSTTATLTKGEGLLTASPSSLDFGTVDDARVTGEPYSTPAAQTVIVTNTGSGVVTLKGASVVGYSSCDSSDHDDIHEGYIVSLPAMYHYKLLPGESVEVTVRPKADRYAKDYSGKLFLETYEGIWVPISVNFKVNGLQINGLGMQWQYDLGEVVEGSIPANATYSVPIKNETSKTLSLQELKAEGRWELIVGPLSKTTLAPGETATFDVTIRPTSKQNVSDPSYGSAIVLKNTNGDKILDATVAVKVLAPGSTPTNPFILNGPAAPTVPAEQPSGWAQGDVKTAVEAGLVPEVLRSQYTQAITRAEFCALADSLYTAVKGSPAPADAGVSFTDTTDPAILRMASAKVVNGVGGGRFNPDGQLTREQAAAMLSRLAEAVGKPLAGQTTSFADMGSVSGYAAEAVGQMQATGIMGGVGNNTFAPKNPYTREQSIVTILRLFNAVK